MHGEPVRLSKPPIESKVKAGAIGAYLGSVGVLAILQVVYADLSLISELPDWLETLLVPLFPTFIGAVASWGAKHTARPDLPEYQR